MKIEYRQAAIEDAEVLANIYNASFYDDYLRFGSCPDMDKQKNQWKSRLCSARSISYYAMASLSAVFLMQSLERENMRLAACALFLNFKAKE